MIGRLATLDRAREHRAATVSACPKCGGGSGEKCAACEDDSESMSAGGTWQGRDLSQISLHGANAQSYDVGNGGDGETSTQSGPGSSGATATQALDGGVSGHCTPSGRFTSIPSGTLTPTVSGSRFNKNFLMQATFSAAIPCNCSLGVYRQYVRGYFKKDGTALTHRLLPGTTLDPTTFQEDGTPAGDAYGHRERPAVSGNQYLPDQVGGCTFSGSDTPGFGNVQSGHNYEINLDFRGELQDISSGTALVTSNWSVVGTAAIP